MKQPQEIEVWYILPTIRREIAKDLISFGLKQKEAANILEVTEPAISQYLKAKRAKDVKFNKKISKRIHDASKRIYHNPKLIGREIQEICGLIKKDKTICNIHAKYDKDVKECNICFKPVKNLKIKKVKVKEKNYQECKICSNFYKAEMNKCPKCGYLGE